MKGSLSYPKTMPKDFPTWSLNRVFRKEDQIKEHLIYLLRQAEYRVDPEKMQFQRIGKSSPCFGTGDTSERQRGRTSLGQEGLLEDRIRQVNRSLSLYHGKLKLSSFQNLDFTHISTGGREAASPRQPWIPKGPSLLLVLCHEGNR